MSMLKMTNNQQKKCKPLIFVSQDIHPRMIALLNEGGSVITLPPHLSVYKAIQNHPDIVIQIIEDELYIDGQLYDELPSSLKSQLHERGRVHPVEPLLDYDYPKTVWMNGKLTEFGYLHHREYTHPALIEAFEHKGIKRIHTQQGYTGCSLVYLGDGRGITSDPNIYKVLTQKGAQLLLITPGRIELPGVAYGFIGGCCGQYEGQLYIHGSLETHPDGERMRHYINNAGYDIVELYNQPLRDIGSMMFW